MQPAAGHFRSQGPDAGLYPELEWRGMVHQVTDQELASVLACEPVVAYVGFDATADSLHVGSLLPVVALQRLQRAGHRPIALIGGATSLIGDPSGKQAERRLLSREQIAANAAGIRRQLESFVEFGDGPGGAALLDNADWLGSLGLTEFLRDVGKHFTVNSMIAREAVRARLEGREQGISFTEFSYVLLQAFDFLHLFDTWGCRLQVGGSDQWGNITAGVDLIRRVRSGHAYGLTWPLVTKADGTKFGKTETGNVWLDPARTSPYQFFQFWINTDDADVVRHLRLLTFLDRERIAELEAEAREHPERREAQLVLAEELTTAVHGPREAAAARRAAETLFGGDLRELGERTLLEVFADAPSTTLSRAELRDAGLPLVDLLVRTGLVPSRSAARTTIDQGGAYVNNRREHDRGRTLGEDELLHGAYVVLRKGRKNHHLVRFE